MASNHVNGPENGSDSHADSWRSELESTISRPLTLQESLPYSPQTVTAPFIPDLVIDPSIGSSSSTLRISDLFPRHEFDRLNKEAVSQGQMTRGAKQAVDLVLHDLKPSQRTNYNFRSIPINLASSSPSRSIAQDLSPIAKAVFDKVGGYFKATKALTASPSGSKPDRDTPQRSSKETVPYSPLSVSSTSGVRVENGEPPRPSASRIVVAIPSKRNFDESAYLEVTAPQPQLQPQPQSQPQPPVHAPSPAVHAPAQQKPKVLTPPVQEALRSPPATTSDQPDTLMKALSFRVELPSSHIQNDEYIEVPFVPDAPSGLSTRRKSQGDYSQNQEPLGGSLDQRERAEAALQGLDTLITNVFNAVGRALGMEPGYDHLVTLTPDNEATLNAATQHKVHGAIARAIELQCFDRIPIESLIRIMKLSDTKLKLVDDLDIRIDDGWDESGLDQWVQQFPELETALKAARTCIRILSGGREDKQIYSESLINRCIKLFKLVIEDIVTPVVELRPSSAIFKLLLKHKKAMMSLFVCCQKLFAVFAELVTKVELSESVLNTLEYTASKLIFVENAHYEKDSVVGVQKFDGIRSVAMDMLCQIFLIKPAQRQGIIDEILTSLEKLPIGKQSSRQFKLVDGDSIQPVSALLMRLVQASSGKVAADEDGRASARKKILRDEDQEDGDEESEDELGSAPKKTKAAPSIASEDLAAHQHAVAIQELEAAAAPLQDGSARNASHIINFIVKRAIGSTKSGDTPYRNLLDLFVEDFTTCLDSPDWPSAELLLRLLMLLMVQLFEAGKTAVPAKNMALELLGSMSAAISRLRSHVKRMATSFEGASSDDLSSYLADLAIHVLEQKSQMEHVLTWTGPYRTTLEYLQSRLSDDPYLSSAVSFLITNWATRVHVCYDSIQEAETERDQELGRLAYRTRMMIDDRRWLSNQYTFKAVTSAQAKLSYAIILLRSPLCESFGKILNILLSSMASDQATVRSKSLKSVNQVLETDPSILDSDPSVIQLILDCSSDPSTQVRDSALGLLGNCIQMRPHLQMPLTPKIIDRFQDAGVGVRKRAMKLARDIYLRNKNKELRSAIANGLLRRVQDPDEGVRDLARQMIEEVWFAPFYGNNGSAQSQTAMTEHVALIIQTVKTGSVTEVLDKVFQTILRPKDKPLEGPFAVCTRLVADMFGLIDNPESEDGAPSGRDALQVLTIFAKAEPKLFNFEQVRLLKPHLASFSGVDELASFRAVNVIYKRVLPQLPTVHHEFLTEKLGAGQLDVKRTNLLAAYSIIVGSVGKHCDLDQQIAVFKARFPQWKGDSVPRLIVDILSPFTSPNQSLDARKASLEAIGLVCQSWPRNYVLAKVYTAFQQVLQEHVPILETMILRSFKEFLLTEEKRSEMSAESAADGKKRELTVMGGTNFDDVASATTQRFLPAITRIAVGSQDEHAFLAMEVLGSINRQGLTHPKETGVTLITLETSANRKIAELAFSEHRSLHEKHETVLEREYVKAVQSAFNYQRDVVRDARGATTEPFQSKLHLMMEVLKISKMKSRQRFLEKLCGQVDFDWTKLDLSGEIPPHVTFSRFIVENVAFLDYQTVGEVQTTVNTVEKIFTATGAAVAQAIESELFNVRLDTEQGPEQDQAMMAMTPTLQLALETAAAQNQAEGQLTTEEMALRAPGEAPTAAAAAATMAIPVEPQRLRQFAASAMILLLLWEVRTHLRRLYGMGASRHDSKAKALAKDLSKTPVKVQGIHGDKFWEEVASHMNGFESEAKMVQQCKAFVELMNVDKEFKVQDDEDVEMELEAGLSASDGEEDEEVTERGRKRKSTGSLGGRKKRPRSSSQPRKRGRPRKQPAAAEPADDGEDDMSWA
ncbi:Protein rad9 [Escovopsis weberi]|uniref:Sister chromatid cohesion protein n=1 Tax=Escovopsis weberi TaxID=150374 RepID=A0A0M8N0U9_ESCWE|nr:Protein rad9 [Escovopsis weberi]